MSRFLTIHGPADPICRFYSSVPLQFEEIRQCDKCIQDPELCKDPVKLYNLVDSFQCPNFLGARVQVNYDINLDLIDKLGPQCPSG